MCSPSPLTKLRVPHFLFDVVVHQLKELTRAEEAAERLSKEYEKKLLLLQQKESLELVKVSITSRR